MKTETLEKIVYEEEQAEKEQLVGLWIRSFGDERKTAEDFYRLSESKTLAAKDGGKIVGMINLVPTELSEDGKTVRGAFIYAACVEAEYRGRGIFRELNAYAEKYAKENSYAFIMLIPANDGLFPMYKKLGYTKEVYSKMHEKLGEADRKNGRRFSGDYGELYNIYRKYTKEGFIKSRGLFEYALESEECKIFYTDGGYKIYYDDGSVVESAAESESGKISSKAKGLYKTVGRKIEIKKPLTVDFFGEDRHA